MKAVILAGGRGTRLAPVTHGAVPKPMAELLGAPMLERIIALLKRCGFRDLCCTTACLPEQIERYFGDGSGFGVHLQYRREEQWRQVRTVTIFAIAYGVEFRRGCFNLEDMTNCADNKMLGAKAEHYKQFGRRRH